MGGQWRKENPNPRVHRSGGKLGEPRFPLERVDPRVGIFLSPLTTHDGFYFSYIPPFIKIEKFRYFSGGRQIYLTLLAWLLIQDKKSTRLNSIVSSPKQLLPAKLDYIGVNS